MQENQILYQSANLRKKISVVLMIIMIVISSITAIIGIIETWVLSGEIGSSSVNMLSDTAYNVIIIEEMMNSLWVYTYIAFVIAFLMWVNRVYKNLIAATVSGLKHTPAWAVGWYFIPFANLFKPYIVMKEIYLASVHAEEGKSWKNKAVPKTLGIWWFMFVVGNLLAGSPFTFNTISDFKADAVLIIISEPMLIISGACLILIMNRITKVQDNDLLDRMNV